MYKAVLLLLTMLLLSCSTAKNQIDKDGSGDDTLTMKDAFEKHFTIGTAMNVPQIRKSNASTDSVIQRHFNSIVAENCMKSVNIHPEKDSYHWEVADAFVQYGLDNGMQIIGHTLAWHS